MARFSRIHFGLLMLACWTCSTCALSLEDKLQILTEKFVRYNLLLSIIPNSYFTFLLKEIVEAKVNHLENENNKLKAKIEQQDSILTDLLQNTRQTNEEQNLISENSVLANPSNGKTLVCRELVERLVSPIQRWLPACTGSILTAKALEMILSAFTVTWLQVWYFITRHYLNRN